MILFNKRITKALINLRGCAGWSALLLFSQTPKDRFSRVEAQIIFAFDFIIVKITSNNLILYTRYEI